MATDSPSWLDKILGYLLVLLLAAIVLLVLLQVCSRYMVQLPFIGLDELARLFFVWACLLGAALASLRSRHIRIEFLTRFLPERAVTVLTLVSFIMILAVSAVMVLHGFSFVVNRWQFPDYTTALMYPRSLFYLPVPLSGAIIFFHTAYQLVIKLKALFVTT